MASSALRILYVGYGCGADAELFGYAPARVSFIEKANDLADIVIKKNKILRDRDNAAKLIECRVPVNTKTVATCQTTVDRRYGSQRQGQSLRSLLGRQPIHAASEDLIGHVIGNNLVVSNTRFAWLGRPKFINRRVPVNAQPMLPSAPCVDVHHERLGETEGFGNLGAGLSGKAQAVNLSDDCIGYSRIMGLLTLGGLAKHFVIGVIRICSPAKMRRVAAWRIIAGVKGYKRIVGWLYPGIDEGHPVGSLIFPVTPKNPIATNMTMTKPFPAVIWPLSVYFTPKSPNVPAHRRVSLNWMFTDISQQRHSQGLMIW